MNCPVYKVDKYERINKFVNSYNDEESLIKVRPKHIAKGKDENPCASCKYYK